MSITWKKSYLHLAGLLSLICYAWLARESKDLEEVPLSLFYPLLAIPWVFALTLWRFSDSNTRYRHVILWAILFRLAGCWAEPIYEDDHFRFLWDGYQFSQTGDPYLSLIHI